MFGIVPNDQQKGDDAGSDAGKGNRIIFFLLIHFVSFRVFSLLKKVNPPRAACPYRFQVRDHIPDHDKRGDIASGARDSAGFREKRRNG